MTTVVGNSIDNNNRVGRLHSNGRDPPPSSKQNIAVPGGTLDRKLSISGNKFQLTIIFSNAENGNAISFKQDGQRFGTSPRTFKFYADAKYKCSLKCKPPVEFNNAHLGGSDLELTNSPDGSGDYHAIWDTAGIDVTRKGARQDILFIVSGPDGTLRRTFQTKFYARTDGHAEWGHKLESLLWNCDVDPSGSISVTNEQVL